MKKNEKYLILAGAAIIIVFVVMANFPSLNITFPAAPGGGDTYYYTQPTSPPSPTAPPTSDSRAPTSLYVVIEPNPVTMGEWVYGSATSDGYKYPITIHAKHVGEGVETSFGALIDEAGQFYHSQTLDTPGYWDFWATAGSVTSNKPRLTVQGAMVTSSRTFFSRLLGYMDTTLKLYCHSAGTAQIFANDPDAGVSIPMKTAHINSGGYATTTFDFSGWSLGTYEIDFIVNGIKASDYGESVWITLGR